MIPTKNTRFKTNPTKNPNRYVNNKLNPRLPPMNINWRLKSGLRFPTISNRYMYFLPYQYIPRLNPTLG